MSTIKLRTKEKEGMIQVKALIKHPMETGLRKDSKTGEKIPAHYIQEVVITKNGTQVLQADWNGSVSKNPYLAFSVKGAAGDKIKLSWKDNTEKSDEVEATV
ncbi:MAG: Sulfur oxidation protein SoxZ [uncultured Thiotrichaceae bacterium]|uniref:Sulfur oxidation protein SoxZ n=1 Tax=uncultured Thiotrichaceae bacterium TaxID=298394 RepID=A0A6S6U8M4_9GAMM|nr:MAG: Sulfur oxidation protein SoxZ [uncultured Thiotrichaceae bacterium]